MLEVIAIARTGALNKRHVLGLFAVGRPQQFAAGGAMRIRQTFEFHRGDHIGVTIITVGVDLIRIEGTPAGGPNDGADGDGLGLILHIEINCIEFARRLGGLGIGGANDARVQHVTLRECHRVG